MTRARWIPTLVVAAVIAVTTFGGFVVAAALQVPAGPPVVVAGTVQVQPLRGWEVARTFAGAGYEGTSLTRGTGSLDVVVTPPAGGGLVEVSASYVEDVLRPEALRLSVSEELTPARLPAGPGARFSYVGVFERGAVPVEGEVTVLQASTGSGVVFDAWAPEGQLQAASGDVRAIEESAEIA